jgi:hypothetical protein
MEVQELKLLDQSGLCPQIEKLALLDKASPLARKSRS